ncbi:hypothetical protein [Actinoallomurus sp. NPDC052274]|uniref:DUF6895 family protein n=1 Tax=Actinoallomurus sp. NPDC052274 TaxID=3155420 RepID=UPI00342BA31B
MTPRAKALLQLAQLRHYWAKVRPADPGLGEVTALVERVWRRPDFARRLAADRRYARPFLLMYGALAPTPDGPHRTALARLAADGYLAPRGKSPYLRLETRYYADLAGVAHRIESYGELYESSELARRTLSAAELEPCNVAHTVFYLGDFGFRDPGLTPEARRRALRVVEELTERGVRRGEWDLVGKLLLTQFCLGADPARTPSGAAGVRLLARAQRPDGAIPGRSHADRADGSATPVAFFRKAYQATLVTALASLIITASPD